MLKLTGIGVRLHPALPPVLADVTLELLPGEAVAVVGPNGSGKSTLARVMAGLVEPTSGVLDGDVSRVGLLLQDPQSQIVGATVADDVAFGLESQRLPRERMVQVVDAVLERLGLGELHDREPHALSGGQQQRVALSGVLACDIDMLVLDEPTSHLDPAHASQLREAVAEVRAAGVPVVWVTQQMEEIADCTRVVALEHGRLVYDGPPRAFVAQGELLCRMGLEPPAATRIALALAEAGHSNAPPGNEAALPLTIDELVAGLLGACAQ